MAKAKIKYNTAAFKPATVKQNQTAINGFISRSTGPGYGYSSVFGRANCIIECAFCHAENRVYVWSLAGSGKRCANCKALIGSYCTFVENTPENREATGFKEF